MQINSFCSNLIKIVFCRQTEQLNGAVTLLKYLCICVFVYFGRAALSDGCVLSKENLMETQIDYPQTNLLESDYSIDLEHINKLQIYSIQERGKRRHPAFGWKNSKRERNVPQ